MLRTSKPRNKGQHSRPISMIAKSGRDPDKNVKCKDARVANWQTAGTIFSCQNVATALWRKLDNANPHAKEENSPWSAANALPNPTLLDKCLICNVQDICGMRSRSLLVFGFAITCAVLNKLSHTQRQVVSTRNGPNNRSAPAALPS